MRIDSGFCVGTWGKLASSSEGQYSDGEQAKATLLSAPAGFPVLFDLPDGKLGFVIFSLRDHNRDAFVTGDLARISEVIEMKLRYVVAKAQKIYDGHGIFGAEAPAFRRAVHDSVESESGEHGQW